MSATEKDPADGPPDLEGVVVGDDGSEESAAALLWAVDEALLRRRPLHVVRAWTTGTAPRPADWSAGYVPSRAEFGAACLAAVERDVASFREQRPELEMHAHAVYGGAASVLVAVSENADLLVVGHRGRAGLRERMVGSTTAEVVSRAGCSVLVVRSYRT
jgi:nucleotide-binding universal stress UspA family protein